MLASVLGGFLLGAAVAAVVARRQSNPAEIARALRAETALEIAERELARARTEVAELAAKLVAGREHGAAQAALLDETRGQLERERQGMRESATQMRDTFQAVASETLRTATAQFHELTEGGLRALLEKSDLTAETRQQAVGELVAPLKDALQKLTDEQRRFAESRTHESATFTAEMQSFRARSEQLSSETQKLTTALRAPHVRGRWGEIQLRRTVELAGMLEHVDFEEQTSVREREEGGLRRPDLLIHLPRGREIVVDSKVPLTYYLDAMEAAGEGAEAAREEALKRHAQLLRTHVEQLASKRYWEQFDAAEFVVMFLPHDGLLAAALERQPELLELALCSRVMLATPTTLVALLRVVAAGWREDRLAKNAEVIADLGRELFERLVTLSTRLTEVGAGLGRTVKAYNAAVGSYSSRVVTQARKFGELGAASERELEDPPVVEELPRELN